MKFFIKVGIILAVGALLGVKKEKEYNTKYNTKNDAAVGMTAGFAIWYVIGIVLLGKGGILFNVLGAFLCICGGAFAVGACSQMVDPKSNTYTSPMSGFSYSESDPITGDYYKPHNWDELTNRGMCACIHTVNGRKNDECCKNCARRAMTTKYNCYKP